MRALEVKRLSVADIVKMYGVSRATLERFIAQGHLTPDRLLGRGQKRWFKPADVEALFRAPAPRAPGKDIDLKALADELHFEMFGEWPKRRHSIVH